jgi:hypothetical protein
MPFKDIERRREWKRNYRQRLSIKKKQHTRAWKAIERELKRIEKAERTEQRLLQAKNKLNWLDRRRASVLGIDVADYTESKWIEYKANKAKTAHGRRIERARASKKKLEKELRAYIWDLKCKSECLRCGFAHPAALQFHHRDPSQKEKPIGRAKFTSLKKLIIEIEKCDIICSNCHHIHHHEEREASLIRGTAKIPEGANLGTLEEDSKES